MSFIVVTLILIIMGTCHSKSEAVADLPSDDPVKCDTGVMADKDDSAAKQLGDNVGLLVKTLSAKLATIATNESSQDPVSPSPRRRRRRRSSAQRRRTSLDSALSDIDIDACISDFLSRARRMSAHRMHRRSSKVSPSSKQRMASVLGHDEVTGIDFFDFEAPIENDPTIPGSPCIYTATLKD